MIWQLIYVLATGIALILAIYLKQHIMESKDKNGFFSSDIALLIKKGHHRFIDFPVHLVFTALFGAQGLGFLLYLSTASGITAFAVYGIATLTIAFALQGFLRFSIKEKEFSHFWIVMLTLSVLNLIAADFVILQPLSWLLIQYKPLLIIFHIIGTMIGAGGATYADIFFFKFLKDFTITKEESQMLHSISEIIWVGLTILVISGLGFYIPGAAKLNTTQKFLAKVIIVSIVFLNGILLNAYISPRMRKLSFNKKKHEKLSMFKRIAFASGAVSIVSWYSAVVLGALRTDLPFTWWQILGIYLFLLVGAVTGSQLFGMRLAKQASS